MSRMTFSVSFCTKMWLGSIENDPMEDTESVEGKMKNVTVSKSSIENDPMEDTERSELDN